jgi:D-serine deaminase-like pyridoxal phosphate-dependent protein
MKSHSEVGPYEPSEPPQQDPGNTGRRWRVMRRRGLGVGVALIIPIVGLGVAACGSSSSTQTATTAPAAARTAKLSGGGAFAGHAASAGGGFAGHAASGGDSNARSTNAAGGSLGTVSSVSSSGFTLSPPGGGTVTVKETSSTVYEQGTQKAAASAVTKGTEVLVLGKVNSTTITASQVVVRPAISLKSASANVITFKKGTAGASKTVGQIPNDYTQGSGKLASGTKATKATEAALKAYAGGVIDRVVQLSNGDYEVHNIGVNWPHHIFVNQDFKVIGAGD